MARRNPPLTTLSGQRNPLQHSASGEALKDLELRLIRHIDGRAMLIIAAIGLIIAAMALLKLFG